MFFQVLCCNKFAKNYYRMANNPISMIKIRQILRLYTQGYSKLKIAEQTGT